MFFFLIIRLLARCLFVCLFVYYLYILVMPYKSYSPNQSDVLDTFVIVYFLIILSLGNTWIIVFLCCCCTARVCLCWGEVRSNLSGIQRDAFFFLSFQLNNTVVWLQSFPATKNCQSMAQEGNNSGNCFFSINLQLTLMVYFEEMGQIGEMSFLLFVFCSL